MPARSFKKLVIAVSGTFPKLRQADLKSMIEDNGATFSTSVTDEVTHLVTTDKDVEKQTTKCTQASAIANCHIVSLSWLTESAEAKKPLPEKQYVLGQAQPTPQPDTEKNGSGTDKKAETKKRAVKDEPTEEPNKKLKDIQKASSKSLNVPVDEGFDDRSDGFMQPTVYIDDAGLIWDATLNQTVSANNANKFYRVQILVGKQQKYIAWTRWGRVGEHGQSARLGSGSLTEAIKHFEGKFKSKTGLRWEDRLATPKHGKYTFLERNYEEDDEEEEEKDAKKENGVEKENGLKVESALSKPIQNLMKFIFNNNHVLEALAAMSYDAKKMPLGKLSKRTLTNGFLVLKELSELLAAPATANATYGLPYMKAIESLSDRYYTLIPHVFGRNRPPTLGSNEQIKKEVELLEALTDMDVTNEIMKDNQGANEIHELDRQFQSLGMEEMIELDQESTEFKELEDYLQNSRGSTHHLEYSVINIFRVERQGENDRFNTSPYASIANSDRRLLWHGSRSTNFGGILSQGLRIAPPEAPVNGYMFGKGVYLADTSSKSANYCCHYNSGGMALLLLCDAEVGAPMLELENSDYNAGDVCKQTGKLATLGKGRNIPGGWKDAVSLNSTLQGVTMPDVEIKQQKTQSASLYYNEYIVYDVAQIRQRYLFQVQIK
ncbi:hypothetical protein PENANT_c003G07507 [Penicillium antarcticum]|uniref:Poly [ADP-ribose] polymerase n=1 Tax=Penicillium antarcticum TaxID=416450 RepID=A0A1V6QIJ6_9EURO|nr:uncharacterized protein N7508_005880 [Penicillium antarcticum]KAJ5306865.1 hypothetical protein N7508_005880 [Penicillium antarcticum]OQD89054.1 hypothetical protein PENANT_c003G07507 [Penicillium antarcticum]